MQTITRTPQDVVQRGTKLYEQRSWEAAGTWA